MNEELIRLDARIALYDWLLRDWPHRPLGRTFLKLRLWGQRWIDNQPITSTTDPAFLGYRAASRALEAHRTAIDYSGFRQG